MHKLFKISVLLLLPLLLWKCNEEQSSSEGEVNERKAPVTNQISYQTKLVEMQSTPCGGGTPCASVYLSAPILDDTTQPAHQRIQQQILAEMTRAFMEEEEFRDMTAVANGFIEAFRVTEDQNEGYRKSWSLTRTAEVYVNTDSLFGIKFTGTLDMGGAHPISRVQYLNFKPATGELLKVDDLPGEEINWRKKAEAQFREEQELGTDESLEAAGYWFTDDQFYLPENFRLTEDSVIFYFNPYEVAPHAKGFINIGLKR